MESDAIGLSEPIGDGQASGETVLRGSLPNLLVAHLIPLTFLQMLVLSCTGATISEFDGSISGDDCVNGTWIDPSSFGEPKVNYSSLVTTYQKMSAEAVDVVDNIPNEVQLTLTKLTRLAVPRLANSGGKNIESDRFYDGTRSQHVGRRFNCLKYT